MALSTYSFSDAYLGSFAWFLIAANCFFAVIASKRPVFGSVKACCIHWGGLSPKSTSDRSFGVKANPNAAAATPVAGVEDAVNITSVVGVWAWGKDQKQKVTVQIDGTAQTWAGMKGVVTVKDPIQRIYAFTWNGGNVDTLTLSENRQELAGQNQLRAAVSAVKRPWDDRCKAGETFFAGLCYDVSFDYAPTAPGFI